MRIAFIADIHGNLPAFEAVLEDIAQQQTDLTVIAGDIVVGAPDSAACWQLAQSLKCPIVRGNHEGYVTQYDQPDANSRVRSYFYLTVEWAVGQLTREERRTMAALPKCLRLPDFPNLLIVHGSLRSDRDTVAMHTPESELAEMFPDVKETYIVRGHNHYSQVRIWDERLIITTGSVGLAQNDFPAAQYLILTQQRNGWKIEHRVVKYDIQAALQRFHDTGYLDRLGGAGYMYMREIATASRQCVPFGRFYHQQASQGNSSFDEALARFLNVNAFKE